MSSSRGSPFIILCGRFFFTRIDIIMEQPILCAFRWFEVYCLQRMVFDINTDMILDFAKPELFHDFAGNRVYMNYYQVDMKDPGKYGIKNLERVTFVDMILDADGETSAYIFEDIPEAKLSWFGVHDFSNIDSFRFLMLAKAEGNCDGQWQIAMRTPVRCG